MPTNDQRPPQSLEAFVHRALRELPAERAPAELEARVFAALAARRRLPWWQAGWRAWPAIPRALVFTSGIAVVLVLSWAFLAGVNAAETFSWSEWVRAHLPGLATLGTALAAVGRALARCAEVFRPWLLGLVVVAVASYAALLALGSGLYRHFLANR